MKKLGMVSSTTETKLLLGGTLASMEQSQNQVLSVRKRKQISVQEGEKGRLWLSMDPVLRPLCDPGPATYPLLL